MMRVHFLLHSLLPGPPQNSKIWPRWRQGNGFNNLGGGREGKGFRVQLQVFDERAVPKRNAQFANAIKDVAWAD